jgi:hypothetical protein
MRAILDTAARLGLAGAAALILVSTSACATTSAAEERPRQQKYHCEHRAPTGSHIPVLVCRPLSIAEQNRQKDQENVRELQRRDQMPHDQAK